MTIFSSRKHTSALFLLLAIVILSLLAVTLAKEHQQHQQPQGNTHHKRMSKLHVYITSYYASHLPLNSL